MRRVATIVAVALFALGGCKWFKSPIKEKVQPPEELTDFEPSVELRQIWSRSLGGNTSKAGLRLRPAYDTGRVYAVDAGGEVAAFDAESGEPAWRSDVELKLGSGAGAGDGLVVVGTLDGVVVALGADDGSERWRVQVSSEVVAAPAVAKGIAVVRANDGRIFGLAVADGARRWVFDRGVPLLSLRGNGPPLIGGDTVYAGYDNGKIVALGLDSGILKWEQTIAQPEGRSELERMVDADGELAFDGETVYATAYHGSVAALSADNGRQLWSRELSAFAGLSLGGESIYVSDAEGMVWGLDQRSGTSGWKQQSLAYRWLSTPAAVGSHVVVGDFEGYVHVLDASNGELAARTRVGNEGIRAAPLVVGDVVYIASAEGKLAALRVGG